MKNWFKILQENHLTSSDYRVLFYLFVKMNLQENTVLIKQQKIAEQLTLNKGNISKCIKRLSKKQFVVKTADGFMVNPHLFYIGSEYTQMRQLFDELLAIEGIQSHFHRI